MLWSFRQIVIDDLKIHLCAPRQHQAVKTNLFSKGMKLYIGRSGVDQCALATVLCKLLGAGRRKAWTPVQLQNQKAMRPRHVAVVREALRKTSLNKDKYGSYSVHNKVTTMEESKNMKHCIIKTLGQWESVVYLQYICIPRERLATISRVPAA